MEKAFNNLIGNLWETFIDQEVAMASAVKILANLKEWRKNGREGIRIGEGEMIEMDWEDFLHGRMPKELRKVLPRDRGADAGKAKRTAMAVVATIFAGAEAM